MKKPKTNGKSRSDYFDRDVMVWIDKQAKKDNRSASAWLEVKIREMMQAAKLEADNA